MARSFFNKRPNRKAQTAVAVTTAVVATVATGGLGLIAAGATGLAWWLTGKATAK